MAKKSTTHTLIRTLLLKPLSYGYGLITFLRNKMFDYGVLEQRTFDIPVVVVGNIAVGGTGKTPHTEYLIELLLSRYHIGVLSRGYNRRTKGFRLATPESNATEIGDEPYQIYRKFGSKGVTVAVCEDRCYGIDKLREIDPSISLILLDDAFQHRYVKPTVSIVLTEYSRPVFNDSMLPAGHLRESISALHRADIVIVTKCPDPMKQLEYRLFDKNLELYPYQQLYFSKYTYGDLTPLYPDLTTSKPDLTKMTEDDTIVVLAGIAHPRPFIKEIRKSKAKVKGLIFNDHHNFTKKDIADLIQKIKTSSNPAKAIVVTTEKDAMRLLNLPGLPKSLKRRIYYIPIKVKLIPNLASTNQAASREFADSLIKSLTQGQQQ
ncbi:MAG: tetraacyldisaccharide 4'-kinase [Bacteroidales bacterium]|nr:tetraacyldisaccharide 4'-kinase [Bacteroidales bacterium]